jgi:hypothetical protein
MEQDFRYAQWNVPAGWHVEGQVLPLNWGGWVAAATWTGLNGSGPHKGTVKYAVGYTPRLALRNLADRFYEQNTVPRWADVATSLRSIRLVIIPAILRAVRDVGREQADIQRQLG